MENVLFIVEFDWETHDELKFVLFYNRSLEESSFRIYVLYVILEILVLKASDLFDNIYVALHPSLRLLYLLKSNWY